MYRCEHVDCQSWIEFQNLELFTAIEHDFASEETSSQMEGYGSSPGKDDRDELRSVWRLASLYAPPQPNFPPFSLTIYILFHCRQILRADVLPVWLVSAGPVVTVWNFIFNTFPFQLVCVPNWDPGVEWCYATVQEDWLWGVGLFHWFSF